jgi:hypothetical protein
MTRQAVQALLKQLSEPTSVKLLNGYANLTDGKLMLELEGENKEAVVKWLDAARLQSDDVFRAEIEFHNAESNTAKTFS